MKNHRLGAAITFSQADVWLLLALLLAVAWVFFPVLAADFVSYDDPAYVTHHPMVNQGLRPAAVWWAFTATHSSNWNPVTSLSHMLDVTLFGLDPAGHHGMNLALHLLNTALVFLLGCQMGGVRSAAGLVAALFALHPLHVESVAWVSQRKDLLSTFFWLLALSAHVKGYRGWVWVTAALAMMAKPMAVTLPLTLMLLDWWPLRRGLGWRILYPSHGFGAQRGDGRRNEFDLACVAQPMEDEVSCFRLVLEKSPVWLMSAAMVVITVLAQRADGAMDFHATLSWGTRISNSLVSSVRYLGRMFWPVELSPFYPYPDGWPVFTVAVAVFMLALITCLAWRTRTTRPWLLFGWLWYGITLLPVSGLVQTGAHALADRYTYVPLLGLFVMGVGQAAALGENGRRRTRWVMTGLATAALIACARGSAQQLAVWQDADSLLSRMSQVAGQDHPVVFRELALARKLDAKPAVEVATIYEEGLEKNPTDMFFLLQTSIARAQAGNFAGAYALIERARELAPESPGWHFNLGEIQMLEGKLEEAEQTLSKAQANHPGVGSGYGLIGRMCLRQGRVAAAVEAFQKAVAVDRWDWLSRNELGVALYEAGRLDEALKSIEEAFWINPGEAGIQQNLDAVRQALKK